MKERKAQAKLISGDNLVKYIDTQYPLPRMIHTAIMRPITPHIPSTLTEDFDRVTCIQREYELYDVKDFENFTLGIYRERV